MSEPLCDDEPFAMLGDAMPTSGCWNYQPATTRGANVVVTRSRWSGDGAGQSG
jgi:hypothetical protein